MYLAVSERGHDRDFVIMLNITLLIIDFKDVREIVF